MAKWPKAMDCKSIITSSNLVAASTPNLGGVAQLAEAKDLKSFQYGFESRLPYQVVDSCWPICFLAGGLFFGWWFMKSSAAAPRSAGPASPVPESLAPEDFINQQNISSPDLIQPHSLLGGNGLQH